MIIKILSQRFDTSSGIFIRGTRTEDSPVQTHQDGHWRLITNPNRRRYNILCNYFTWRPFTIFMYVRTTALFYRGLEASAFNSWVWPQEHCPYDQKGAKEKPWDPATWVSHVRVSLILELSIPRVLHFDRVLQQCHQAVLQFQFSIFCLLLQ